MRHTQTSRVLSQGWLRYWETTIHRWSKLLQEEEATACAKVLGLGEKGRSSVSEATREVVNA